MNVPPELEQNWQRGGDAWYFDGSVYKKATGHTPRVSVDPETGREVILAEPQRKNMLTHGADGSAWTPRNGIWEPESIDAPDGTPGGSEGSAGRFIPDSAKNFDAILVNTRPLFKSGNYYTISVWVKPDPSNAGELNENGVRIDTGNGNQNRTLIRERTPVTGEWERWHRTFFKHTDDLQIKVRPYGVANNNGNAVFVWGAQVEKGRVPTTTIPTSGGTKTRPADNLSALSYPMAQGAKATYFHIKQEGGSYSPGEGGNVSEAEVNLTTAGNEDSPGNGLMRPSTGILGISADGWIDAVINSSDADIQGNSTTSAVEKLTIQPDKDTTDGEGAVYKIDEISTFEEELSHEDKLALRNGRPEPWHELDGHTAEEIKDAGNLGGVDEDPRWIHHVPDLGIAEEVKSTWDRSTEARVLGPNGKYVSTGAHEPRLKYDMNGNREGMLVEGASRTNRVPWSSKISDSKWSTPGASTETEKVGSIISGENAFAWSADKFEGPRQVDAGTFTSGEEVACVFVEERSADKFQVLVFGEGGNNATLATIDWANEGVSALAEGIDAHLRVLSRNSPNEGSRLAHIIIRYDPTNAQNGDVSGEARRIELRPNRTGTGQTIFHHAQVEEAPNASSPIVTGSSAVTRSKDGYSIFEGGQPDWWNPNEGTFYLEVSCDFFYQKTNFRILHFDSSPGIRMRSSTPPYKFNLRDDSGVRTAGVGNIDPYETAKIAASFTKNEQRISVNGSFDKDDHDGSHLLANSISFSSFADKGQKRFSVVKYIPRALSESTLNTITS